MLLETILSDEKTSDELIRFYMMPKEGAVFVSAKCPAKAFAACTCKSCGAAGCMGAFARLEPQALDSLHETHARTWDVLQQSNIAVSSAKVQAESLQRQLRELQEARG